MPCRNDMNAKLSQPYAHRNQQKQQSGLTLIELLISIVIGSFVVMALMSTVTTTMSIDTELENERSLFSDGQFAMKRIERFLSGSKVLILPLAENPATAYSESVRDVLAFAMPHDLDIDFDGWSDANNDKDYFDYNGNSTRDAGEPERIDEDMGHDMNNDGKSGILGIDDDNDGSIDENATGDDDEDEDQTTFRNEEKGNNYDNDWDGAFDEDNWGDQHRDGEAGLKGFDDDGDGSVDEGDEFDDDEDGFEDEDWLDSIVYFVSGTNLIERMPEPQAATGTDYTESIVATNVSSFQVERIFLANQHRVTVKMTLVLTDSSGQSVTFQTTVATLDEN
jgi:prepilin-type N-terminal cleavage/methylation domain-containing protein